MSDELQDLIKKLEKDDEVKVVVFDSADPDYFMAHLDLVRTAELSLEPGATGLSPFPDFLRRLEQAPFVTVGVLRGRVRGVGSEFLLGLDIRFASREKAILSQIEVGTGVIPGAGGIERLSKLIGRARALEVILGSEGFDADTAALYGWVNRSIPVAGFDRKPVALAKKIINERVGLVPAADLAATQKKFFKILAWPKTQARVATLLERGLQQRGDFELRLGEHLGSQSIKGTTEQKTKTEKWRLASCPGS